MTHKKLKIFSVFLAACLFWGIFTVFSSPSNYYDSDYMQYKNASGNYDIKLKHKGRLLSTTYLNEGFETFLKVGTNSPVTLSGTTYSQNSLNIKRELSFLKNGKYVKVSFNVSNSSSRPITISLASMADIQLGNNDTAPIEAFADGSGFLMSDSSGAQFSFIGKSAEDVADVDSFWFGNFEDMDQNKFNNTSLLSFSGGDSGMAFSWKNRMIPAFETQTFSVLFSVSPRNSPPVLSLSLDNIDKLIAGQVLNLEGSFTDQENSGQYQFYCTVNDSEPFLSHTMTGTGTFSFDFIIPHLNSNTNIVSVFVKDSAGAVSNIVSKAFTYNPLPEIRVNSPVTPVVLTKNYDSFTLSGKVENGEFPLKIEAEFANCKKSTQINDEDWSFTWSASQDELKNGEHHLAIISLPQYEYGVNIPLSVKIDTLPPTFDITLSESEKWVSEDVTITVQGTDKNGLSPSPYSFDGGVSWQENGIKAFAENSIIPKGSIIVKDFYGNTSKNDEEILINCIDKTPPSFSLEDISFTDSSGLPIVTYKNSLNSGYFFKITPRINVSVSDIGSGAAKLWYQFGDDTPLFTTLKENGKFYFDLPSSLYFKKHITLYAEDIAGNITQSNKRIVLDNICVDKKSPEITVNSDIKENSKGWFGETPTFYLEVSDAGSGLHNVLIFVNGQKQGISKNYSEAEKSSQKFILNHFTEQNTENGEYKIDITAYDNSGNKTEFSRTIKIDTEIPEVLIAGNAEGWSNNPVKLVFSNGNAKIKSGSDIFYTTAVDDSDWNKGDTLTISENFNGKVRVKIVTKAGHEAYGAQTVKLALNSDMDITGAVEGGLYNIARKISIKQGFSPIKSITCTIDGKDYTLPENGIISQSGHITLTVTDEAGNIKTLGYTLNPLSASGSFDYIEALKTELSTQFDDIKGSDYADFIAAEIKLLEMNYNDAGILSAEIMVKDLNNESIKSSHQSLLEAALKQLNNYAFSGELLPEQKNKVETLRNKINSLSDFQSKFTSKTLDILSQAKKNPYNKTSLIALIEDISKLLATENLTDDERTSLNNAKTTLQSSLSIIENETELNSSPKNEPPKEGSDNPGTGDFPPILFVSFFFTALTFCAVTNRKHHI